MNSIKKSLFFGIMLILICIVIELFSLLGYGLIHHAFFSAGNVQSMLNKNLSLEEAVIKGEEIDLKWGEYIEIIHPYLGFVGDPYRNKDAYKVSEFGFVGSKGVSPILKKSSEKVIIGIFGGSVAKDCYTFAAQSRFKDCLKRTQNEIVVLNFAAGGYKQPQQLLILTYLLSLGAEFDLIVNIDGFNEVALPPTDNIPHSVYPFYPRLWHARTKHILNYEEIKQRGYIEFLKYKKMEWAKLFYTYHLYWSPTFSLLWEYRDRVLSQKLGEQQLKMNDSKVTSRQYVRQGPEYTYSNDEQLFMDLAKNWFHSSLQMKKLCETNGIYYYHFLQPNQYVEGSKPMSDQETKIALSETMPYKYGVIHGYPILKKFGEQLLNEGVNYTDLTMLFADHHEVLYRDIYCHFNMAGNNLIFDQICQVIRQKQNW